VIITRIQSEDFLKYRKLDIRDLPEKGLITVGGANESGKTSIGETLCFGLFGRTFTLDLIDPRKLIRWGAARCSVTVEFKGRDGKLYEVTRYLDDEGGYGARLLQADEGIVLAKGPDDVDKRLRELNGFGYDEFIESFYLAQRELTTPHPHSHTIKVMAGIAPLTEVAESLTKASEKEENIVESTGKDFQDVAKRYHDLEINEKWKPALVKSRKKFDEARKQKASALSDLDVGASLYEETAPVVWKSQRMSKLLFALSIVAFTAAALFWVVWATLNLMPDSPQGRALADWLQAFFPTWRDQLQPLLQPLAWLSTAVFGLSLLGVWLMNRKAERFRAQAVLVADDLKKAALELAATIPATPKIIARFFRKKGVEPVEHDYHALLQEIGAVQQAVRGLSAKPEQLRDVTDRIDVEIAQQTQEIEQRLDVLDKEIKHENKRLAHADGLKTIQANLNRKLKDHQRRIKVNDTAVSLLDAASHHLSHRFNREVLLLAGEALPVFTQGRYKHLKIDENLDVRVFSNDKRDFMDFDETSSGTQRQIMLSLRLAMTQELIKNIEAGRQFIFFDEPFAFFDQERIRNTLEQLPNISADIAQIWLVAQEFPEGTVADYRIDCHQVTEELMTGRGSE